jgi:hypothetical protein
VVAELRSREADLVEKAAERVALVLRMHSPILGVVGQVRSADSPQFFDPVPNPQGRLWRCQGAPVGSVRQQYQVAAIASTPLLGIVTDASWIAMPRARITSLLRGKIIGC